MRNDTNSNTRRRIWMRNQNGNQHRQTHRAGVYQQQLLQIITRRQSTNAYFRQQ